MEDDARRGRMLALTLGAAAALLGVAAILVGLARNEDLGSGPYGIVVVGLVVIALAYRRR